MDFFRRIFFFYSDGFRNMTIGKNLWLIIVIKLFIIFAVFRLFFFHDFLNKKFDNQKDKSEYVIDELINRQP
jgi:Na+/H+ antiporter NhaD/arsenite permease-like protein